MANTAPELTFQQHIADFLVHTYHYALLEQSEITDTENAKAGEIVGIDLLDQMLITP